MVHCAKTVVRATRQIVGGNYKASSCGRCQGDWEKWCESKKERKKERKKGEKEREKKREKRALVGPKFFRRILRTLHFAISVGR